MALANTATNTNGIRIPSGSTGQPPPALSQLSGPAIAEFSAGRTVVSDMGKLPCEPDAWIDVCVEDIDD